MEHPDTVYQLAQEKVANNSWYTFFNRNTKLKQATDLYAAAANGYKRFQMWEQAGCSYEKAYECDSSDINYLLMAFGCYLKVNLGLAEKVIDNLSKQFYPVGLYQQKVAEKLFVEGKYCQACKFFEKAAESYINKKEKNSAIDCYIKLAKLHFEKLENYKLSSYYYLKAASATQKSLLGECLIRDYIYHSRLAIFELYREELLIR